MATDDEPTDSESRRELERKAFSRPRNKEEQAAAESARRQLAALQETAPPLASAPTTVPAQTTVPELVEGPPPIDFDDDFIDEPPRTQPRPRTLIPLLVIIGLALGIGGGIAIAHFTPSATSASSANTPTPTPTRAPGPLPNATTAISELNTPQTAADIFPDTGFATSLDLETDSTHRILTTDDGLTLWIAKSPQAICMLYTGGFEPTGSPSGATCASIFEFGDTGLTLSYGHDLWSWDGISFTTTIEH